MIVSRDMEAKIIKKKQKAAKRLKEIEEARMAWEKFKRILCEELHLEQLTSWLNKKLSRYFH